ncbi:MAG: hypothetical protein IT460_09710 [Planctomycetes bacterium]|nr:hypothetical protein [Planctomycetota bacterium]
MAGVLPFRRHAEGYDRALAAAEAIAVQAAGGDDGPWPPTGFTVVKDRPMRVTLTGALPGPDGPVAVFVKVRRPAGGGARRRRRPRGAAEGHVLETLRARGVAVPDVLGWSASPEAGVDVLLLRAVPGATDLATWAEAPRPHDERRAVAEAVGLLLRRAHDAGWSDRDVHRGNVLVTPTGPVLVDPGLSAPRAPLPPHRRVHALARAAHGLGPDVRTGLAALRAYAGGDRETARRWFPLVAAAARPIARAYRRGRARRATRTGRHFETFPVGTGGRGVRATPAAPAAWKDLAVALVAGDVAGARPLKADGRVVATRLPGREQDVVVKRYDAVWRDRLRTPRALRAFRRAYALRVRGVACPEPLLAAADASGAGAYVAAAAGPRGAGAVDLHVATHGRGDAPPTLDALAPRARRDALHRCGRFLRRLHDAEVSHRDLKAPNLVAWRGPRGAAFAVVDLDGARLRSTPVPWRRRLRDLARLDASAGPAVSRADRVRVLRGYLAAFERAPVRLADAARRVARASVRKRGPSGAPR